MGAGDWGEPLDLGLLELMIPPTKRPCSSVVYRLACTGKSRVITSVWPYLLSSYGGSRLAPFRTVTTLYSGKRVNSHHKSPLCKQGTELFITQLVGGSDSHLPQTLD